VAFNKQAPKWGAIGIEPPESKRSIGWEVEDRPPAAWLNWFMNLTAESLQELQSKAAEKTYVEDKIAEAIAGIDVDIPDASLTVKGITQLNSAVDSTSETQAATPKAVKIAYDEAQAGKQAGNKRKAEVVAALVAKGIQATLTDSWATLIPKITAIVTATGTAVLADVLAGKTFSTAAGNAMVGTMPNRSGQVQGSAGAANGSGDIFVVPPFGYYDGLANTPVKAWDLDFIASNFRADKNIFGLQGSIPIRNGSNGDAGGNHHTHSGITAWEGNLFVKPTPGPPIIYEGDVWLKVADPDFVPKNIRSGVDMFGLGGTLTEGVGAGEIIVYRGSGVYTSKPIILAKSVRALTGGTYRVKFSIKSNDPDRTVFGQVYINDVPRGLLRDTRSDYPVTFTEDISVNSNGLIQLYIGSYAGAEVMLTDFTLGVDLSFETIK